MCGRLLSLHLVPTSRQSTPLGEEQEPWQEEGMGLPSASHTQRPTYHTRGTSGAQGEGQPKQILGLGPGP